MAAGDITVFNTFVLALAQEKHNWDSDSIRLGLITDSGGEPSAAQATAGWADFSSNEVAERGFGSYPANDGYVLANSDWSQTAGVGKFIADNVSLSQSASGFTDARYGIIYNKTLLDAPDDSNAIAWVDLGADLSMVAGPININWAAAGIITVTANPA